MLYVKRFFCSDKNREEVHNLGMSSDVAASLDFSKDHISRYTA
jgi:hypothetical protein